LNVTKSPLIQPSKLNKSRLPEYKSLKPRNLREVDVEQDADIQFGSKIINFNLQMYDSLDSEP